MTRKIASHRGFSLIRLVLAFRADPLRTMADLRGRDGDLVHLRHPLNTVFVFHPDDVRDVLSKHARVMVKGAQAKVLAGVVGDGLFTSEGAAWRAQRQIVGNVFQASQVRGYGETIRTCASEHLARWPTAERLNLSQAIKLLMFDLSGRLLFGGIDAQAAPQVQAQVEFLGSALFRRIASLIALPPWVPTAFNRRFSRATRSLDALIYRWIEERRSGPEREDFLQRLLRPENGLSARQIRDEALTLLIAGFETTATMLIWTLHLLAAHPEYLPRLSAEARAATLPDALNGPHSLIKAVLSESLRLYPPSPIISRQNTAPIELAGQPIETGTNFVLSQYLSHRDPRFWVEADRFYPERFYDSNWPRYSYFPFSLGPRKCIGEELAYEEGITILWAILRQFSVQLEPQERRPICEVILHPDQAVFARLTRH